ncbi:MAG: hypothetical protein JSV92_04930 [archaeon]|nr:MAG: hypothetical protein JSV92_04930 [archaeon]
MTKKNEKLKDAPEDRRFWVCDGRVLKNFRELEKALRTMSDGTYNYHVNGGKNDFYNWIKDVFKDKNLAEALKKSRNKTSAANKLKRKFKL